MSDIYYIVAHRSQEEIDSFKTRYERFDASCIPKIFHTALGAYVTDVQPSASWGSSHVVYFVTAAGRKKPYVFRANLGFSEHPETVMKTEQLICQKVSALGIPTNTVVHVDISRKLYPFDYQIQECLEGEDLEKHFHGTSEEYDALSFDLGAYIAKFSRIQFEKFGMFDETSLRKNILKGTKATFFDYLTTCVNEDISYLTGARIITTVTGKTIQKLFHEYQPVINSIPKGSLVHHDLADHNIFFKNGKITGIFDWETAISGDPVLDLASCPTWRTHYPREEKLVDGYKSVSDLPAHFEEKMNIYRLRTMLWKMVYAIRMGIVNETRKQKFADALAPFKLPVL